MATTVATKPSAPHQQKMKRPPLPNVQPNGVQSSQSSRSPSASSKRPPSGFQHPSVSATSGLNGDVNGLGSRLGSRRRDPQKPGDAQLRNRNGKGGLDGERRAVKRMTEPFVKTQSHILKRYKTRPPSLIIHLHLTHFRFDQQDGSFSYNSPMKFILEHLKTQTIPHDMLEELQNAQVRFYEGCLIVQVQDHRTNAGTSSSTSTNTSKSDKNIPFSIHNYNEHLTPSPYVPYPQKEDAVAEGDKNKDASQAGSDSATASKYKQPEMGPKIFTVVLFPTPLSLHEEVYIQANTPDPRNNRKQSTAVPRTPASATVPATPLSAVPPTSSASGPPPFKKLKMSISGSEIHGFESKAVATTAPPLFLDPVDKIEDTFKVLNTLTDPRYKEDHPAPKARKRTEAELAADEAIAAQEQEFMLIMDERHGASGAAGVKAGTADGEAGGATFEPRFETWQAIKNIRAEHKERAEREAIEKAQKEAQAADNKRRLEQQERLSREQTEHRAAQMAQEQQHLRNMQRQQQMTNNLQPREARRQQQLAASQNQPAHGHPMPNGISQAPKSSPVVRNVTPHNNSSPLVNNISMNGPVTSSPARPTSAMQHGHTGGVAMDQQRSRQRASSRTSTPQMNGTPSMQQATPRLPQGSPPMSMASNPVMNHNVIANQHLNGPPTQLSHQQRIEIIQQRQQQQQYQQQRALMQQPQQRMQNASPNPQMSPDRNAAHMQTLQQAQLNQQRQQQHEYQRSLAMHHQALGNGAGHNNIPNGASPPPSAPPGSLVIHNHTPNSNSTPYRTKHSKIICARRLLVCSRNSFPRNMAAIPPTFLPMSTGLLDKKLKKWGESIFAWLCNSNNDRRNNNSICSKYSRCREWVV
ncbi:hypothetical protein ABVK25_006397 [Lepraria finkii]|uniref:Spt20-like SEP domain-containing protein n=1 Tax=Lepraria finkii TaxID=1340010 RepID=A0ABR4B7K2_9LECA